ncbi:MAG: hypothetical protein LVQ97_04830 [Candidatus Micrarchaeales archaeon]|jgi:hypothetical protein|uniref:Uncharacterized protein n=1 Tax=Candidatus Micrarchaeum acidiphilum ARMAN-2 TaxID=425595 RepID=C7DGW6_MICA2|nr:MAG: hypothetical protein UNLARM2_0316 [Candidatus Micrarchaeum acidiphilum ARMAN-2]MCW6161483.1 hypothetical protein [Candidatus Micrarchaeales archaeon]
MNSKTVESRKAASSTQLTLDSAEWQPAASRGIRLRGDEAYDRNNTAAVKTTNIAGAAAMSAFAAGTGALFTITGIIRNVGEFALLGTDIVIVGTAAMLTSILLFGGRIGRKIDKVFHPVSEERLDRLEREIMEGKFSAAQTCKCNEKSK